MVQLTGDDPEICAELFISWRDGEPAWYVRNDDGSVELLTDYDSFNWDAVDAGRSWSPDGERITFVSGRDGGMWIYVMNADGTGVERLTDDASSIHSDPAWSTNGDRIAFESYRGANSEIYVMNADGSGARRLAEGYGSSWSPDDGHIAFASHGGIYVMSADGSGMDRLGEGHSPSWSPVVDR